MTTIQIPSANSLYHLSYDIISKTDDKEKKNEEHLNLKRDLVWEILVTKRRAIIKCFVSSTIIFESTQDFTYWDDILERFAHRMNFVLTEVQPYHNDGATKYLQLSVDEVPELNANFHRDIVDYEIINYDGVARTRAPGSRVL